jgi:Pentapeptide repeats (8 copies)
MPWWVVAAAVAIVVIATAVWWWLPKWQVNLLSFKIRDPKARADVEDNFRKTIGQYFGAIVQLIAGAAVLIGAWIAYNQMLLTLQVSNDQIKAAYGQIKASGDQLISQQVSKGFELLGDDKLARRLGGIYALEGVMNASEQYYQPVLEALCAFVRDNAKAKIAKEPPATDIQAALTVIGRRAAGQGYIDLSSAYVPKADLRIANLTAANLRSADLPGAKLRSANLSHADLTHADLTRADLTAANLRSANLPGVNLGGADLFRANLTAANLADANLADANLTGANLTNADLTAATGLSQDQLDKACGDKETKLPSGLTIKLCPRGWGFFGGGEIPPTRLPE